MVPRSHQEREGWNTIDPNLVIESERSGWLARGSFWDGIKKMRPMDPSTGKRMMEGSGAKFIEATTGRWRGRGHQAILRAPGRDGFVFHT